MPDAAHKPLNRQDVERVAHEALGRQLRLMVAMSALLLVLGFVVGQFTGASLARRNTERLQSRVDQLEQALAGVEARISEQRDEHLELEQALIRIEDQRRDELAVEREALAAMIDDVEATRETIHTDLDEFDTRRRTVPTAQVRGMVDRFATEQAQAIEQLLTWQLRRLGLPQHAATSAPAPPAPTTVTEHPAGTTIDCDQAEPDNDSGTSTTVTTDVAPAPPGESVSTAPVATRAPRACCPRQERVVGSDVVRAATAPQEPYIAPPKRAGFLFFAPSQPRRIDPTRISDSASIPLPPR